MLKMSCTFMQTSTSAEMGSTYAQQIVEQHYFNLNFGSIQRWNENCSNAASDYKAVIYYSKIHFIGGNIVYPKAFAQSTPFFLSEAYETENHNWPLMVFFSHTHKCTLCIYVCIFAFRKI